MGAGGMGIIAGALSGAGQAGLDITKRELDTLARKDLAQHIAEITRLRDERLEALKRDSELQKESRGRQQYADASAAVDAFRTTPRVTSEGEDAMSALPGDRDVTAFRRSEMLRRGLMKPSEVDTAERDERRLDLLEDRYAAEDDWRNRRADIEEDRWTQQFDFDNRKLSAMLARTDTTKDLRTPFERNIKFMVESGIAKDPADAYGKWKTGVKEDPKRAVQRMASTLMRSGDRRYKGQDGAKAALDDAQALVGSVDDLDDAYDPEATLGGKASTSSFANADAVRNAYREGRIDRSRAMRELQQFGFK